jgi:iron complex outermembrane recepter protein
MNQIKTIYLLLTLIFASSFTSLAQQSLKITVRNTEKSTLPGATVQLTRFGDSVKFNSITNLDGVAVFEKLHSGNYLLNISFMGYKSLQTTIKISTAKVNFEYTLNPASLSLGEVTITAKKPLIRQEDDKMIIDPEPIANTTTNTLEVLESTPGLYVDPDGAIYLSTTTPAAIYINGREQKMSSQDISNLLRNLPPNSVEKIEVIRVPSTKYDAASSGGIINIVLKKGVKIGRFGTVNAGMNQGKYGNRFVGFSLNHGGLKT